MTIAENIKSQTISKPISRDAVLRLIPQFELQPIFKRHHLNRERIDMFIGLRGDGKSGSGAVLTLIDDMLEGLPVHSNMTIACKIEINDDTARRYGLKAGGIVEYRSIPLDKKRFLRFDPMFTRTQIFGDEFNVEFADARRSMSNTNLFSGRVAQELRHIEASLRITAISEMTIDQRIRDNADIVVKVEDTALTPDNLERKKPAGLDFKWIVYPMSRYLTGVSWHQTKKPLEPMYLNFEPFRGIYDDKELQGSGMTKYGIEFQQLDEDTELTGMVAFQQSPIVREFKSKWGWLGEIAVEVLDSTEIFTDNISAYILASEIWEHPEVLRRQVNRSKISEKIQAYELFPDWKWNPIKRKKMGIYRLGGNTE